MERSLVSPQSLSGSLRTVRPCTTSYARQIARPFTSQRQQQTNRRRITTMGLFGLGLPEVAVVAGIAALVFGPSKLPELGKELGKTVKSFQTAAKEFETELKTAAEDTTDKIEDKVDQARDEVRKQ